ncbi:hypothetical protein [Lysobacter fragariae]
MSLRPRISPERPLYVVAGLVALLIVFSGFARTYYLKQWFGTPGSTLLVHVHGLVMTGWFLLFAAQTQLVAAGRTDLHRRLGVFGAVLALAVLIIGPITAITGAALGRSPGPPPLMFLAIPLMDMVVFAILVGSALRYRKRSDYHKRLMLLTCLSPLTAAIARIPIKSFHDIGIPAFFITTCVLVIIAATWDTVRNRRLHPAFIWGGGLILVSWPLRLAIAGSAWWQDVAKWLTS